MKKAILLLVAALQSIAAFAQPACTNQHRIFKVPPGKTPTIVTKLGSNPQFAIMCNVLDGDQQFKNMKALAEIPKYKKEINELFQSMGYTGVSDPRFTRDKLSAANLPFGAQGMLGDGNHKYVYSLLALPGEKTIRGWRVEALEGCDLYFMSKCGNAFYYTNPPQVQEVVKYIERDDNARLKVKVYARYDGEELCTCNDCCGTTFTKGEVHKALIVNEEIENIPVITTGNYPVKTVFIDVDKATYKKIKMYDVNHKYCKHKCDNNCADGCGHKCDGGCKHSYAAN